MSVPNWDAYCLGCFLSLSGHQEQRVIKKKAEDRVIKSPPSIFLREHYTKVQEMHQRQSNPSSHLAPRQKREATFLLSPQLERAGRGFFCPTGRVSVRGSYILFVLREASAS